MKGDLKMDLIEIARDAWEKRFENLTLEYPNESMVRAVKSK